MLQQKADVESHLEDLTYWSGHGKTQVRMWDLHDYLNKEMSVEKNNLIPKNK